MDYKIFFNEKDHVYTNEVGNKFISATTLIGKYEYKFEDKANQIARACSKIGRNPNHPKYLRYKGKSPSQILAEWKKAGDDGCAIGNEKHNYLEDSVKTATGFEETFGSKYISVDPNIPVRLYTIQNIIDNPDSGYLDLQYFKDKGVEDRYPKIYSTISAFVNDGWRVYSEVAVYHAGYLISGLIDILLVKGNKFVILDWKTNKADFKFEAGYWEKDNNGEITNYKLTDDTFRYPLDDLPMSVGNKYGLQLSLYAYLVEQFGLEHMGNILCHIKHDIDDEGRNIVNLIPMTYMKDNIVAMIDDYVKVRTGSQISMFN